MSEKYDQEHPVPAKDQREGEEEESLIRSGNEIGGWDEESGDEGWGHISETQAWREVRGCGLTASAPANLAA